MIAVHHEVVGMPTFAELLKQLREKAGMTQAALSSASGLSLGVIRDYEQGKKEPALRSAFKLAEALGVSVEQFKADDPPSTPRTPKRSVSKSRRKRT
jgi:transcriptional regulator with XRE-family HTH domain